MAEGLDSAVLRILKNQTPCPRRESFMGIMERSAPLFVLISTRLCRVYTVS